MPFRPGVGRTTYPVLSNTNGSWPTFQSVHPSAILPLPLTSEVKWYVASDESSATIPPQFEDINAATRTIGGLHSLWGYPVSGSGTTTLDTIAKIGQTTGSVYGTTTTLTYSSTVGNTLVLSVSSPGSNTITDTAGNTWALLADTVTDGASAERMGQVYYCISAAAVGSVTLTRATAANMALSLTEWSNVAALRNYTMDALAANPVDATIGDLVLSNIFQYSSNGTPTATPSGYTGLTHATETSFVTAGAYRLATTTGAQDPNWNNASIGEINASFRPTAS